MSAVRIALAMVTLLLLLLGVVAIGGYWLLTTESGRDFALERAEAFLPPGSSLGEGEGVLVGPLTLHDLRLRDGDQEIAIDRLELDWSPAALLASAVRVDRLIVDGVRVKLPATEPAAAPAGPPALPDSLAIPFPVRVDAFELRDLVIERDAETLGPFALALGAEHDGKKLRFTDLHAHTPWGEVSGSAALAAERPHALDGALDWSLVLDESLTGVPIPAAQGTLEVAGVLEQLDVRLEMTSPDSVIIAGEVEPLRASPRWDLEARFADLVAQRWHADAPDWPMGGRIRVRGDVAENRVSGNLDAQGTPVGRAETEFALFLDRAGVAVETLELQAEQPAASLSGAGTLDWSGDEPVVDAELSWRDVYWPAADPQFSSRRGEVRLQGQPTDYRLSGAGEGGIVPEPPGEWQFSLEGHDGGLHAWRVSGDWLQAAWAASGDLDWQGNPAGGFELTVEGLDPMRFDLPIAGAVDAGTRGSWTLTQAGVDADVELSHLGGRLAEQDLGGQGAVRIRGDHVELRDVALRAGAAQLDLDGPITPEPAVRFRMVAEDLADFVADAGGSIRARGRVEGELERPGLELDLAGDNLAWSGSVIDRVRINAELPTDLAASADLTAEIVGVRHEGRDFERIRIGLDGTLADHALDLRLDHDGHALRLDLVGGLDADYHWAGDIRGLDVRPADHEPWTLVDAVPVRASRDGAHIDRLCLVPRGQTAGAACANAEWDAGEGWRALVELERIALGDWVPLVAPDLDAVGALNLRARARGAPGAEPQVDATLDVGPGHVAMQEFEDEDPLELLAWQQIAAGLRLDDRAVEADLVMPLEPTGGINAELRTRLGEGAQPLAGSLRIDSESLPLLARLIPEIGRIEGRVDADLGLAGTTERPEIEGRADLVDGLVTLPDIGLRLTDVAVEFAGEPDGLRGRLAATSGPGDMAVEALARRRDGGWHVDGTITGDEFRAIDTPDARVNISPRIEWSVAGRDLQVGGELDVPWARLNPRDLGGAVRPTPDLEIVGTAAEDRGAGAEENERWRVHADVQVQLGEDVRFDGFGLRGRIAGGLRLRERPGELTTATGEVEVVDGTYRAYQQELTIERGRLIYDGGVVTDPGLDIRAVRRPRAVLVGVSVRGTLQDPDLELFSEPTMQQSQILSYLILGMPIGEAGDEDRTALNSAIAGAGGWVAGQVGGGFGIDDISIEEGATQGETELVLGTYLHPRLYVSYGVGLFESFSRVRMRYTLTQRWAVEGESGPTSSGDLLYSIER